MRTVQPYRRRSSSSFWLGMALLLLLILGSLGLLFFFGVIPNPFGDASEDPFMVRIPVNGRPIPAYQRVAREDLIDPATGSFVYQKLPPASTIGMGIVGISDDGSLVESGIAEVQNRDGAVVFVTHTGQAISQGNTISLGDALMNPSAIVGRVVKRDKRPGMGFREGTFFPRGTPSGLAGATPPGMRTLTLDATLITGVHSLRTGDNIDLLASVPVGKQNASTNATSQLPGAALVKSTGQDSVSGSTEPVLLAEQAVVLKSVYVRNEATTSASLTEGQRVQNVPKYEVAIAVAPEDVLSVQNALDQSLKIICVAHSMQAGEDTAANDTNDPTSSDDVVYVPVTVRAILAYDVVTREAFYNRATRKIGMAPVDRQEIEQAGIITSLNEAIGSVARHDIPAGRYIRKSDLLSDSLRPRVPSSDRADFTGAAGAGPSSLYSVKPAQLVQVSTAKPEPQEQDRQSSATAVGDRPSITRFIPKGYTAIAIPWNRLYGAEHLQIGDELDLMANYSLETDNEEEETETRPDGTVIKRKRHQTSTRETLRTWDESFGNRGEPWFVASDAIVVGPVGFPAPASALRALGDSVNRSSGNGNRTTAMTGPPLLIAVLDRDVESVGAALATQQAIFSVAFHPKQDASQDGPQTKRIAIAAQNLSAFDQFTELIWQGNRRRPVSRLVSTDDERFVEALTVDELREREFRVLARNKRRGEFFTRDDFLPAGSKPGIAAAAGPGETIFAVADREIEGLDSFQTGDIVSILIRGVTEAPSGVVTHGLNLSRPVSRVVVAATRIARESQGGQTVLAVSDLDVTRLQAAWASSTDSGGRSRLVALALPRIDDAIVKTPIGNSSQYTTLSASKRRDPVIPDFDGVGKVRLIEAIKGTRREWHAFPENRNSNSPMNSSFNFER